MKRLALALAFAACDVEVRLGALPDASTADAIAGVDAGDASDASFVDVGVDANFDLKSLSGLVLWLDAGKGLTFNGSLVTAWADQSNNGNDATQATVANQPTLTASAIHGLPGVHFDASIGQVLSIADSPTLQWGMDDFYVAAVVRYDNDASLSGNANLEQGYGSLYAKVESGYPYPGVTLDANVLAYYTEPGTSGFEGQVDFNSHAYSKTTGYNDGSGHLLSVHRVGVNVLELRHDGVVDSAVGILAVDVSAVGFAAQIGASADGTVQRLDGDIAELVAVRGPLAPADLAALEAHLKAKYALP